MYKQIPLKFASSVLFTFIFLFSSSPTLSQNKLGKSSENSQEDIFEYVQALKEKASALKLYEQPYWLLLLHARADKKIYKSEIIGGDFFLSVEGDKQAQAELYATLHAFFEKVDSELEDIHPQCRFPARFLWLKEQLGFDKKKLPKVTCSALKLWMDIVNPNEVALVFASHYLGAPASAFGHTFLKVSSKRFQNQELLSYTINYAASIPQNIDILRYVFYGLGGGFGGVFSVFPYHVNVKEYNDLDKRDLWEYKLQLNKDEIERMLLHTYELLQAKFAYYFFKENCSYVILSLLEVARPSLKLRSFFHDWTIPTDTLKLIEKNKLISKIHYRPSHETVVKQRLEYLSEEEREWFYRIVSNKKNAHEIVKNTKYQNKSENEKSFFLDTVLFALRERSETQILSEAQKRADALYENLLKERTKLPSQKEILKIEQRDLYPHYSHSVFSLRTKLGYSNYGAYVGIAFRSPLHDLLDREDGYPKNSALVFLDAELRLYEKQKWPNIYEINIFKFISLPPFEGYNKAISYLINTKIGSEFLKKGENEALFFNENEELKLANTFEIMGLSGWTYALDAKAKSIYSIMLGGNYRYAPGRAIFRHTVAPILSNRFLVGSGGIFKGEFLFDYYYYNLLFKVQNELEASVRLRFILNAKIEALLNFATRKNSQSMELSFTWHL